MEDDFFPFYCTYCGKDFGMNNIALALHIAAEHDAQPGRSKLKKTAGGERIGE